MVKWSQSVRELVTEADNLSLVSRTPTEKNQLLHSPQCTHTHTHIANKQTEVTVLKFKLRTCKVGMMAPTYNLSI